MEKFACKISKAMFNKFYMIATVSDTKMSIHIKHIFNKVVQYIL